MTIKASLTEAMKNAMKARDQERLNAIRLALSDFKRVEVDERIEIDDLRAVSILHKMIKQRKDSVEQFSKAERHDLVAKENFEINILQEFLPQALSQEETNKLIDEVFTSVGSTSMKDMGKIIAELKNKIQGRADMGAVSQLVKAKLS